MDAAILLIFIGSYLGLVAQSRFNDAAIVWLTVALSSGGIVLALESGLSTTATIVLTVSQFVVWIYSIVKIMRSFGAEV